jgi:hypothetical protein
MLPPNPWVTFVYGPRHESARISVVRLPPGAHARDTASSTLPFGKNRGLGFVAECQLSESVSGP